ncbi:hypothetical protein HY604_02005 [Candidatus Peregrinibacteria bacterium]|nr:hypothetical protein [Candidatus Peregrinibacteria bacterium]
MFKEKYLIFQRGNPSPEASKPVDRTEAELRQAKENAARSRREMMEKASQVADRVIEDIFGHNADIVKDKLGPKYDQIIDNLGDLKPGEKYLKSVLKADGIHIFFVLDGRQVDFDLTTALLMTDEEIKTLWPLVTLKREDIPASRSPESKQETFEARADKYIMGPIMEMFLHFMPDSIPDDFDIVSAILKTSTIKEIRKALIESYKRGKPYEITTTDYGFKLESEDPDLKTKEYDLERFFTYFKPTDIAGMESGKDKTADLDAQWAGRTAEDMSIDDLELLLFGDESKGIRPRTIAEIEKIYGQIPDSYEEPKMDALITRAQKQYFPAAYGTKKEIKKWEIRNKSDQRTPEDAEHIRQLAHKQLDDIVRQCPETRELDALVNKFFENMDDEEAQKNIKSEFFGKVLKLSRGTMKQAAAAKFYEYFIELAVGP